MFKKFGAIFLLLSLLAALGCGGGGNNGSSSVVSNPAANAVPVLTSLSLTTAIAGSPNLILDLNGSGFVSSSSVWFGTTTLTTTYVNSSQLKAAVPDSLLANAATVPVTISNPAPGGGTSNSLDFTVANPVPSIETISIPSAIVGSSSVVVDITGTNFNSSTRVNFGTGTLTPSSFTKTSLSVLVPGSLLITAGLFEISVFNPGPGGGKSGGKEFMVANPSPTLKSLSYSLANVVVGKGGFTLTISGKDFISGATVDIGSSTGLTPTSITSSQITVAVPSAAIAAAGRVDVTVHNPPPGGGTSGQVLSFTVNGEPPDGIWAKAPWQTVVNAGTVMPNSTRKFNSYTQPAVNKRGLVVFRAHSKGTDSTGGGGETAAAAAAPTEQGEPVRGIYKVDVNADNKPVREIASGNMEVPWPNNTAYQNGLARFNEFPSIVRLAIDFDTMAFRGQSQPVWTYTNADGTDSRAGSAGIYVVPHPTGDPQHDKLLTGVGLLGAIPLPDPYDSQKDFSYMRVPGATVLETRFDQFPGSPTIDGQSIIAFKGNYTEGDTGRTGVYFRDIFAQDGRSPVQLVANSTMIIPNQPKGGTVPFGSTAPPSAADGYMVFAGYDNEDAPTLGGLYRAPLIANPLLETLVSIGDTVPGETGTFNKLSEGLSFDGRYVGFWGSWGSETKPLLLICATDGNKDMIASCNDMYPSGFETSVPAHQGIFVYDTETKQITTIAKTGANFDDFVYWVFSGRPPNVGGGGDEGSEGEDVVPEPPRWRSSSFVAVSGKGQSHLRTAFKAKIGSVDGIYLRQEGDPSETQIVVDTTMLATNLDPTAPAGASISSVGVERDGFRGDWLAITTGMLDPVTSESWSGIYAAHIPQP